MSSPQEVDRPSAYAREPAQLTAEPWALGNAPSPPRSPALPVQTQHLHCPPPGSLPSPWDQWSPSRRVCSCSPLARPHCSVSAYFLHGLGFLIWQMVIIITMAKFMDEIMYSLSTWTLCQCKVFSLTWFFKFLFKIFKICLAKILGFGSTTVWTILEKKWLFFTDIFMSVRNKHLLTDHECDRAFLPFKQVFLQKKWHF